MLFYLTRSPNLALLWGSLVKNKSANIDPKSYVSASRVTVTFRNIWKSDVKYKSLRNVPNPSNILYDYLTNSFRRIVVIMP